MLKKSIEFTDFDGNPHVKDFYFNLTKADLAILEIQEKDGLVSMLNAIIKTDDRRKMIDVVRNIIRVSYGVKSADGMRHQKGDEVFAEFEATNAYSELFYELCTDANKNVEFILGVIPREIRGNMSEEDLKKQIEDVQLPDTAMSEALANAISFKDSEKSSELPQPSNDVPAWKTEGRVPTDKELMNMPREELIEAMRIKNQALVVDSSNAHQS